MHLLGCHALRCLEELKALQRKGEARAACIAATATTNKGAIAWLKGKIEERPVFIRRARAGRTMLQPGPVTTGVEQVKMEENKGG